MENLEICTLCGRSQKKVGLSWGCPEYYYSDHHGSEKYVDAEGRDRHLHSSVEKMVDTQLLPIIETLEPVVREMVEFNLCPSTSYREMRDRCWLEGQQLELKDGKWICSRGSFPTLAKYFGEWQCCWLAARQALSKILEYKNSASSPDERRVLQLAKLEEFRKYQLESRQQAQ